MLSLTHNLKAHLNTTKRRKETSRGHCWYHYFLLCLLYAGLSLNIRPLPQQQKAHQLGPPFLREKRPSMVPTPLSTALSTWPRPKECLRRDLATIGKRGSPFWLGPHCKGCCSHLSDPKENEANIQSTLKSPQKPAFPLDSLLCKSTNPMFGSSYFELGGWGGDEQAPIFFKNTVAFF